MTWKRLGNLERNSKLPCDHLHSDNHDHRDGTDQRTNEDGRYGTLSQSLVRTTCAKASVQSVQPAVNASKPMQPGRGKDVGVRVVPLPSGWSCLTVICSKLKLAAAKTFCERAILCKVCHSDPVFSWTWRKSQTLCFEHGDQKERPQLKQLLSSASSVQCREMKAGCFPCCTWQLRGQP